MEVNRFADIVKSTLTLDVHAPPYAIIASALINKAGTVGAYVGTDGILRNSAGNSYSTSNSITNVTITDPGVTGATLTLDTGSTLATSGAYSITLTATASTAVTLPTSGTLATRAGSETLTNKTLTAPVINGATSASGNFDLSGSSGTTKTTTGTTTIGGALAFKVVNTAVAAAGSDNTGAGALTTASIQHVSSDSSAKGVILPTGVAGYKLTIINDSSTACKLYPDSGGNVNGATTTTGSVTIPASKGVIATCTVAGTWIVFDLAAKSS